jgi:hypothetical protein
MKYTAEMGSGVMVYIPSFVEICSSIQKLIRGIHGQHGDSISLQANNGNMPVTRDTVPVGIAVCRFTEKNSKIYYHYHRCSMKMTFRTLKLIKFPFKGCNMLHMRTVKFYRSVSKGALKLYN